MAHQARFLNTLRQANLQDRKCQFSFVFYWHFLSIWPELIPISPDDIRSLWVGYGLALNLPQGFILPTWINSNSSMGKCLHVYKCGVKLLFHSQTPTVQPLKSGDWKVISSNNLLIHVGVKVNPCYSNGIQIRLTTVIYWLAYGHIRGDKRFLMGPLWYNTDWEGKLVEHDTIWLRFVKFAFSGIFYRGVSYSWTDFPWGVLLCGLTTCLLQASLFFGNLFYFSWSVSLALRKTLTFFASVYTYT